MVRNLFKRTQVRLAATFTILFTLAASTLFGLLLLNMTDELEERVRARVERTRDALLAVDRRFGFNELSDVVSEEAESVRDADSIFTLLDQTGVIRAGNVKKIKPFEGWSVIDRKDMPAVSSLGNPQDRFFTVWSPVSNGMLLVGRSDREVRQAKLILVQSLGWGLLATAALGIGAGVYLSGRAQRRIDNIANTLTAVASGNLDRRVSASDAADDLDQVAQKINAMLGQLQRLIQNVNQSSTDIAHDLKKPIGRLRERLEVANEKATTVAQFQDVVRDAILDVDQIVATFEALLNISQLQAGDRKARFTDVDLRSILSDVVDLFGPVVEDAGARLSHDLGRTPSATIRGDRELLVQLFANLVENALRHCPQGVAIEIGLGKTAHGYTVDVIDNGPGIPPAERDNVFRRFYRIEPARSGDGHGLGLSLVAAIADLHGAVVTLAENDPGLRVTLEFPGAPLGSERREPKREGDKPAVAPMR